MEQPIVIELTIIRCAELALGCQDACNGRALLASLLRVQDTLRRMEMGTEWVNRHPIVYLFLFKLMALSGHEVMSQYGVTEWAEFECHKIVAGESHGAYTDYDNSIFAPRNQ